MPIEPLPLLTPPPLDPRPAHPLRRPTPALELDRELLATRNPFLAVRSDFRPPPDAADVARDLDAALRGDPRHAETRAALLTALVDLQNTSLGTLSPAQVDGLFAKLAAAFDTWPDTTWARDLVAVAVATLGVHVSWKNDGARTLAALSPETVESFRALARYVDAHAETYGAHRAAARGDAARRASSSGMAVLTDREAELADLGLEASLDALIRQTRRIGGLDPASTPGAAASPTDSSTGVRSMAYAITLYAESRKSAALQQLERGDDLSQAAIMRLQEELQAANQLIMAMSQILRKEGELGEQLARNIV
jgi:hypothetical protein